MVRERAVLLRPPGVAEALLSAGGAVRPVRGEVVAFELAAPAVIEPPVRAMLAPAVAGDEVEDAVARFRSERAVQSRRPVDRRARLGCGRIQRGARAPRAPAQDR